MKQRMLTSNILSLIKRNIPSICTVLILSSLEPRKGGGEHSDLCLLPSVVNWPSQPGALSNAFLCLVATGHSVQKAVPVGCRRAPRAPRRAFMHIWEVV